MAINRSTEIGIQVIFPKQILNDDLYPHLTSLFCIFSLMFSVPAVYFNAINLLIFCKIGVTDSITVCFLHLAVCDFCTMVFLSIGNFFKLLFSLNVPGSKDLSLYTFATATAYGLFLDVASATTTYIALQRGLCVAWPFLTRHAFTRNRSLIVLMAITVILLGSGMPRSVTFRFIEIPDPTNNSSKTVVVHFFHIYSKFDALYLIFVKIIMGFTQYIIMSICAVAIFIGMRSSMRLKLTSLSLRSDAINDRSNQESFKRTEKAESTVKSREPKMTEKDSTDVKTETKNEKEKKAPKKEILVIKQALTVVLLQVLCTTPGIIVFIYSMFETRFKMGTEYHNLFYVVYCGVDLCYAVNAFANFFIYLNFNTKFRQCFNSAFHSGKRLGKEAINSSSRK